jgi:hypothetical protein
MYFHWAPQTNVVCASGVLCCVGSAGAVCVRALLSCAVHCCALILHLHMQVTLYLLTSHTSPEHLRSDVEAFVDASLPAVAGSEHRAAMLDRVRHVASPPQASAGGSGLGLHTDTDEELGHRGSYLHPATFSVNVNANEPRLGFSNTTRNPEGILSHNNTVCMCACAWACVYVWGVRAGRASHQSCVTVDPSCWYVHVLAAGPSDRDAVPVQVCGLLCAAVPRGGLGPSPSGGHGHGPAGHW